MVAVIVIALDRRLARGRASIDDDTRARDIVPERVRRGHARARRRARRRRPSKVRETCVLGFSTHPDATRGIFVDDDERRRETTRDGAVICVPLVSVLTS